MGCFSGGNKRTVHGMDSDLVQKLKGSNSDLVQKLKGSKTISVELLDDFSMVSHQECQLDCSNIVKGVLPSITQDNFQDAIQ